MKIKSRLSKLNHKFRFYKKSKKVSKEFFKNSIKENAVPWIEIKSVFQKLQPMKTEYDLIRMGSDFDGGYLLPDDLKNLEASFSPGVNEEIGFDLEISKICNRCYLADASVDEPAGLTPNMNFLKKFIGNDQDPDFIKFEECVNKNEPQSNNLILQMDIEGAEYDILSRVPNGILEKFRIILIEFHDLNKIFNREYFEKFKHTFEKLEKSHTICHLHCNNSAPYILFDDTVIAPVFELTYLRNDRINSKVEKAILPHKLDQPNCRKIPDPQTPNFWQ